MCHILKTFNFLVSISVLVLSKKVHDESVFEMLGMGFGEAKDMPKTLRNLILLKEDCGEACDTNTEKYFEKPGKYFDVLKKDFECDFLFEEAMDPILIKEEQVMKDTVKRGPPTVYDLPKDIAALYTYDYKVQLYGMYINNSKWTEQEEITVWSKEEIEYGTELLAKGELRGGYGSKTTDEIKEILQKHMDDNVNNCHVLVIGSQSPWIETILLSLGASKVTTLEYAPIESQHPQLNPMTPLALRKIIKSGEMPQFDSMVTFSSIEHSGLGRYGDALNPWGDLIAMAQAWCLLKPGARALVGVPGGKDAVHFNAHRTYGRTMLAHLFANWDQIYSTYRDFPQDLGFRADATDFCDNEDDSLTYCFQLITVLQKT